MNGTSETMHQSKQFLCPSNLNTKDRFKSSTLIVLSAVAPRSEEDEEAEVEDEAEADAEMDEGEEGTAVEGDDGC